MIKCPVCSAEIKQFSRACETCKTELSQNIYDKINEYFLLKEELRRAQASTAALTNSISNISKNLELLAFRIDQDLTAEHTRISAQKKPSTVKPFEFETTQAAASEAQRPEPAVANEPPRLTPQKPSPSAQEPSFTQKTPTPAQTQAPAKNPPPPISFKATKAAEPPQIQFGSWGEINVGQKLLLIAGIVTMVFGIGFFLKYSFDKGWIGPAGRVALAYLWGAAFLALGNTLDKRGYHTYGRCLVGGAIAVLYFATYAGFQIYHLFPQTVAFFLMLITTAFAALLALKYDTQWLAVLTTIGGFFTPILLSTGVDNQIILMSYMLILNVGVLTMASIKNWRSLFVLAFVFTYFLYLGWYTGFYSQEKFWSSIIFLNLFFVIYAIIPYLHLYRTNNDTDIDETSAQVAVFILFFNSLIAGIFDFIMIKDRYSYEWMSVVTVLYAALFTLLAAITMARRPKLKWPITLLISKAILFTVLTVPCLFSKHIITVLWAAQAAILYWLGTRTVKKQILAWAYLVLLLSVVKFFFYDYFQIFRLSLFGMYFSDSYIYLLPERLFTALFIPVILFWFSRRAKTSALEIFGDNSLPDSAILMVFFWITLFITLNIETAAFFHEYLPGAKFASISVLWSLFATILMLLGFRYRSSGLRNSSLLLFLITIIKVFFMDIAKLSTPYRIISFIILGLVLIGVSYLYHKYKKEIENAFAANKAEKKPV